MKENPYRLKGRRGKWGRGESASTDFSSSPFSLLSFSFHKGGGTKGSQAGEGSVVFSPAKILLLLLTFSLISSACQHIGSKQSVQPRTMRDVPAERLAYSFNADVPAPEGADAEEPAALEAVKNDFDSRRMEEALVRTVASPDGQRALALYETDETAKGEFRIDLYSSDGRFLRNLTPPDLSGAFAPTVAWSPDGNSITFIGRKALAPKPSPTPLVPLTGASPIEPVPVPSIAPAFAPVPVFSTEQVYICNRDGFDLKPLTTREGLIYFYIAWAPDGHALVALACKEDEWDARERESKMPAGRPRLIALDGSERLLDDSLTEAAPAWSPDSSKVATAFETDVAIYDAATTTPTQARIPLHDPLLTASADYDEQKLKKRTGNENGNSSGVTSSSGSGQVYSFNPIVRLLWADDKTLYFKTAYVRLFPDRMINTYQRWHVLHLSPQAAVLSSTIHTGDIRNLHAARHKQFLAPSESEAYESARC
ncbi:MAG TPA: hypothetical protein VK619_11260 [Pyrinomonadaceae bacterium]|nr:hypothetical protein [Pyrinomonadaceae bacterium]